MGATGIIRTTYATVFLDTVLPNFPAAIWHIAKHGVLCFSTGVSVEGDTVACPLLLMPELE